MRLDALRRRPALLAALIGAVVGLAAGAIAPPPVAAGDTPEREAAWSLPDVAATSRQDDRAFQAVRQAGIWRATDGSGNAASKWALVGVVAEGDQRTALLLVDGKPDLVRVHNGDPLPDDGRVVDIGRFGMRINIYGCENLILRLYTPGQRSPAPDCGYAADNVRMRSGAASRGAGSPSAGKREPPGRTGPVAGRRDGAARANRGARPSNGQRRVISTQPPGAARPNTSTKPGDTRRPGEGARPDDARRPNNAPRPGGPPPSRGKRAEGAGARPRANAGTAPAGPAHANR